MKYESDELEEVTHAATRSTVFQPRRASNDLICGSSSDESAMFDVLTKDDAHTIDIG